MNALQTGIRVLRTQGQALTRQADALPPFSRAIMRPSPFCIAADALQSEAEALMSQRKITAPLVIDERQRMAGVVKSFHI